MDFVKEIKNFVEEECKKPTSHYGYTPFKEHFVPVHKYAKILAEKTEGADVESVEIAAWMHDIGSIVHGRKDHHLTGARIAEEKLNEMNYPREKTAIIKHCILAHRGSQAIKRETKEAEIIAEADAMSHFDELPGLFKAAFVYEKRETEEARDSIKQKLVRSYDKLSEKAKGIIKPKFEAAMLLLN